MDFIGRTQELAALQKEYERDSGFVVIYGRRRVGKTRLIKEFIKDKNAFYFLATQEVEVQCMKRFAGVIARKTGNPMLERATFSMWDDLFRVIVGYKPDEKKVIVLDEFPYLVKTNPAFPSILQTVWDEILKDSNVMLILCGSLLSMMKKHALAYESPLYGRRTAQIRLMPLNFTSVAAAQPLAFESAVEQYAVTGGVPKYMELFQNQDALMDQISELVLSRNGFLFEEPYFLLNDEVQVPITYFSIIKVIAAGNHKLSAIATALEMDTSRLTPYLSTLADLAFVEKRTPITEKSPEKSRKGQYFISDNFLRFWFRYVYPYKGELELDNKQIVLDEMAKDFTTKFVAFAYEDICKDVFAKLCAEKAIPFTPSKIGSYWLNDLSEDTEIDVMAVDVQNKRVFAGECKYHKKEVDAPVYFALKSKVEQNAELQKAYKGYSFSYGIFSKSGFTQRLLDVSAENQNLYLIEKDAIRTAE